MKPVPIEGFRIANDTAANTDVDRDDGTVTLGSDAAIRLDAEESRQMHNRGVERANLVLAGAPLTD